MNTSQVRKEINKKNPQQSLADLYTFKIKNKIEVTMNYNLQSFILKKHQFYLLVIDQYISIFFI